MKKLDAIDLKILNLLQQDATMAVGDIASQVGLSQTPCWRRIQRLRADGVITATVALVQPEAVGLDLTVFVTVEATDHLPAWLNKFTLVVERRPEVLEVHRLAGHADYLLKVVVADMAAFDRFYRNLIADVPMRNVSSQIAMERVKATTAVPLAGTYG